MSDEQDQEERTLPATQKRLDDARADGRIPRSQELTSFSVLAASGAALWMMGPGMVEDFRKLVRAGLTVNATDALETGSLTTRLSGMVFDSILVVAPLLGVLAVAGVAGTLAVGGWLFSTKAFTPQFDRLNPMNAVQRIFSAQGMSEIAKTVLKACLIGVCGAFMAWSYRDFAAGLAHVDLAQGLAGVAKMVFGTFGALLLAALVIASLDVPLQLWRYYSQLRMSLEEVKRENKESEGDPHVKGRIRSQQREMARRRMMSEVPKADVIVTNPTHYAVALAYREGGMRAPQVVAKGADQVAFAIRELGSKHGVPLLEAPPLARAIYKHAEIGDEIPPALYGAVAQVLAWVFQLRNGAPNPQLKPPVDFDVAGLDPGEGLA